MSERIDETPVNITDGIFFTMPPVLSRGRHELSREEVLVIHRERLMIAATELLASDGYQGVGVREITARARVSRAAFYAAFDDKDACVFAAYERFIEVLLSRLTAVMAPSSTATATVNSFLEAYLSTLQLDLVAARAFHVEFESLGAAARKCRRDGTTRLATLIRDAQAAISDTPPAPLSDHIGGVYAVRDLVSDALDQSAAPELLSLLPVMSLWTTRLLALKR
ncbi:TetR/AcrR family transcriptional regulator [Cryobacterium psychrophilum]|uniref:TetR/AcrR family transcriptional regulator n=1 Tax=Cryobacterium psychrophilum TaxID=41988 RepID=A0A4Y8KKS0_9MICO|nr:TetR/AcrR family transcriptional regulator [Cryobacterium psychrophilum]TDW28825.1 TetR family transcriptional regulator [Cryobacterium psychrophilum]TFD76204.1 TetR/AcrR family transcriptional regulator [Cryobacterium psychrophilum]